MAQDTEETLPACENVHELPPELMNLVMEHLHDDLSTLCSCTLVSHSWLRYASHQLFFTINFDVHNGHTIQLFLSLLKKSAEPPLLCQYVRHVNMTYPWALDPTDLHFLTSHFPHLRRLEITMATFSEPRSNVHFPPPLPITLQQLTLRRSNFRHCPSMWRPLLDTVNVFARIERLYILLPICAVDLGHAERTPLYKTEVEFLTFKPSPDYHENVLIDLACRHLDFTNLKFLEYQPSTVATSFKMQKVLDGAPSLTTFWLDVDFYASVPLDVSGRSQFTLERCTSLKTLGFLATFWTVEKFTVILEGTAHLLRTLTQGGPIVESHSYIPSLTSLCFELWVDYNSNLFEEVRNAPWAILTGAIESLQCRHVHVDVRIFHFLQFTAMENPQVMLESIKQTLEGAGGVTAQVAWRSFDTYVENKQDGW